MEVLISFIVGLLVAGTTAWSIASRRGRATAAGLSAQITALQFEKAQLEERSRKIPELSSRVQELEAEKRLTAEQVVQLREAVAGHGADNERLTKQIAEAHDAQRAAADALRKAEADVAKLDAELSAERKQMDEKIELLDKARTMLSDHFQTLATDILEKKGERLTGLNKETLGHLIEPLKAQIDAFQRRTEDIQTKETERQATLRTEIAQMKELNLRMTDEAHALATALRGEAKIRGNWGEMVLESALERSGLQEGKDYRREVSFDTDDGRRRPDVIVYLPQNRHLVIDSKVSLNAYTTYINANDELERAQALKEHCQAVAQRVKELSSKDYYQLPGLNSPEVVFMFIPLESAFVEAMRGDDLLFETAVEHNVLIATPTTLLTSLNIVRQLWRFEEQNATSAELAARAAKVYKKLNTFLQSMQKVGNALNSAKNTYQTAMGQLYSGPGNLIKQASEFKQLGVSVQGSLPQPLVDKAMLEIPYLQDESSGDESVDSEEGEA